MATLSSVTAEGRPCGVVMLHEHLENGGPHWPDRDEPRKGAQLRTTTETGAERAAGLPPDTGEGWAAHSAATRSVLPIESSCVGDSGTPTVHTSRSRKKSTHTPTLVVSRWPAFGKDFGALWSDFELITGSPSAIRWVKHVSYVRQRS